MSDRPIGLVRVRREESVMNCVAHLLQRARHGLLKVLLVEKCFSKCIVGDKDAFGRQSQPEDWP